MQIILKDQYLLVINKPDGAVVEDIQAWVEKTGDILAESVYRSGIVHRLDKYTTGCLIIARYQEILEALQKQFEHRQVKKKYMAIIYGSLPENEVAVNAPIGRNTKNWEKFGVVKDGKSARTYFKEVAKLKIKNAYDQEFSLIECYPESGRTHQIRVHLTALNCPVAGDLLYSGRTHIKKFKDIFPRQMLHASQIQFKHPVTDATVIAQAPLPADMQKYLP